MVFPRSSFTLCLVVKKNVWKQSYESFIYIFFINSVFSKDSVS